MDVMWISKVRLGFGEYEEYEGLSAREGGIIYLFSRITPNISPSLSQAVVVICVG